MRLRERRTAFAALTLSSPTLIAIAVILSIYIDTGSPLDSTYRVLAITLVVVPGITVGLAALYGATRASTAGAAVVLLVLATPLFFLLGAVLVARIWWAMRRRRLGQAPRERPSASALPTLATAVFVVVVAWGTSVGAFGLPTWTTTTAIAQVHATGPDIFIVLLDGYPRADTLAGDFDFDNEPFLEELRQRGFRIASGSRSNYPLTGLTLPSMLYMRHVTDIDGLTATGDAARGYRMIARALAEPMPALEIFEKHGYETVGIPTVATEVKLRNVGRDLDSGHLTQFEIRVLGRTLIGRLVQAVAPDFIYDDQRARVLEAIDHLHALANDDRAQLVFAHLMLPHAPFIFGPHGERLPQPTCLLSACTLWDPPEDRATHIARYRDQVRFLNDELIRAIDEMRSGGADPVIVLMSDHGSRAFGAEEKLLNFFAAVTPSHPTLFPDDVTPVNVLARLASAYLGEGLGLVRDSFFLAPTEDPLQLEPLAFP